MDKIVLVFSDIEMGQGGERDDFPQSNFLVELFSRYNFQEYTEADIEIVFNGDTFDFLKIDYQGRYPHFITEKIAKNKFEKIYKTHKVFFEGIEEFLKYGKGERKVHFIYGNHDSEIMFKSIQNLIKKKCGGSENIFFPGFSVSIGDVYIEHGSQVDPLFYVDPKNLFIKHNGEIILNLPWASVALLNVLIPLQKELYHIDRLIPKRNLFNLLPELKEWMQNVTWDYWKKDYLAKYLKKSDPLKVVSWTMIKEIVKRSMFFNPDVQTEHDYYHKMVHTDDYKVYVLGHEHHCNQYSYGNRKFIQLGCMRNEFMIEDEGRSFSAIPKSYLEIKMRSDKTLSTTIHEVIYEDFPESYWPSPLPCYKKMILSHLGPYEERLRDKVKIEQQEEEEGGE